MELNFSERDEKLEDMTGAENVSSLICRELVGVWRKAGCTQNQSC